jgi:hypothetical protein
LFCTTCEQKKLNVNVSYIGPPSSVDQSQLRINIHPTLYCFFCSRLLPYSLQFCSSLKSFEASAITLILPKSKLTVFNIYRPPPSSIKAVPFSQFITDFQTHISHAATISHGFLITGDLNLHVDDPEN